MVSSEYFRYVNKSANNEVIKEVCLANPGLPIKKTIPNTNQESHLQIQDSKNK